MEVRHTLDPGNTVLKGRSETSERESQLARNLLKNTKSKVQGCLACEHGINVNLGRRHTDECRHTTLPSLVTDSLWTVKFWRKWNCVELSRP